MQVAIFSPYSSAREETGLLLLIGRTLAAAGETAVHVRCPGSFAVCDRDSDLEWQRTLTTCMQCSGEANRLVAWSQGSEAAISRWLTVEDLRSIRAVVEQSSAGDLPRLEYAGFAPWDVVRPAFSERFAAAAYTPENSGHAQFARRAIFAVLRQYAGVTNMLHDVPFDISLLARGGDMLSGAYRAAARRMGRRVAVFNWSVNTRAIEVSESGTSGQPHRSPILIHSIENMRPEPHSWPEELKGQIAAVMGYLKIAPTAR